VRVLLVSPGDSSVPPPTSRATSNTVYQLATHLSGLGVEVHLISTRGSSPVSRDLPFCLHQVDSAHITERLSGRELIRRGAKNVRYALRSVLSLRKDHPGLRFDILHCHSQFPGLAFWAYSRCQGSSRPRFVYTPHAHEFLFNPAPRAALQQGLIEAWCIRHADGVTAEAEGVRSLIAGRFRLAQDRVWTVPPGLDVGEIDGFLIRRQLQREPASPPTILHVARVSPEKGHSVLLHAASIILSRRPDVRFVCVGPTWDTPYLAHLRGEVARLGISEAVHFTGEVGRDDLLRLYDRAAVVVLPSLREMFGIPVLEAWAFRKPVVASDITSFRELLTTAGCGDLLFPAGSPSCLAERVLSILEDPLLAIERAGRGRWALENYFNWRQAASAMLRVYEAVLAQSTGA